MGGLAELWVHNCWQKRIFGPNLPKGVKHDNNLAVFEIVCRISGSFRVDIRGERRMSSFLSHSGRRPGIPPPNYPKIFSLENLPLPPTISLFLTCCSTSTERSTCNRTWQLVRTQLGMGVHKRHYTTSEFFVKSQCSNHWIGLRVNLQTVEQSVKTLPRDFWYLFDSVGIGLKKSWHWNWSVSSHTAVKPVNCGFSRSVVQPERVKAILRHYPGAGIVGWVLLSSTGHCALLPLQLPLLCSATITVAAVPVVLISNLVDSLLCTASHYQQV